MPPGRLTLDMTVVFDVLNVNEKRPRHRDALALFSLAEWGEVELGIPPQGSLADRHEQFDDELAERLRELASRPGVVVLPQLARLSTVTFPSPDLYPGHHVKGFVKGFDEAWAQAAATWNRDRDGRECPGAADRWYAESHIAGRRDMLVTDDGCLRSMCERLRNEHSLPVRAEGLAEYVARKTGNRA